MTVLQTAGLSHSDTRGSKVICTSPRIFAAYRVLHRLLEPRHPPSALIRFSLCEIVKIFYLSIFTYFCLLVMIVSFSYRIPLRPGRMSTRSRHTAPMNCTLHLLHHVKERFARPYSHITSRKGSGDPRMTPEGLSRHYGTVLLPPELNRGGE